VVNPVYDHWRGHKLVNGCDVGCAPGKAPENGEGIAAYGHADRQLYVSTTKALACLNW